jgi:hypothetical protein
VELAQALRDEYWQSFVAKDGVYWFRTHQLGSKHTATNINSTELTTWAQRNTNPVHLDLPVFSAVNILSV